MKVSCGRKALLDALQGVSAATTKNTTKPHLSCVRLKGQDDCLTVSATDLEVGICRNIRGVTCGDFVAVVSGQKLTAILNAIDDETVVIDADDETATIATLSGEQTLPVLIADQFPEVPTASTSEVYQEIKAGSLQEILKLTTFAIEKRESTRFAVTGLLWHVVDGKVQVVGTDTRRLSVAASEATLGGEWDDSLLPLLPPKALGLVLANISDPSEPIRVSITRNDAHFSMERATIHTRLIEGRFPPYKSIVPKSGTSVCVVKAKLLSDRIKQAAITTEDDSRRVNISFGDTIVIKSGGVDVGKSSVRLTPTSYKGDPVDIAFDPAYLTDYLSKLDPDSEVTLKMTDGQKPAVFFHGDNNRYLVMPLAG